MLNVLQWLLAIELIGLMAFPIGFGIFSRLPDRGYTVAKPLGLILLSWPLWVLGSLHLVPTNPWTLWTALALLSLVSGWHAWRRRMEMLAFFRRERHAILIGEGIFLLLFLAWVLFRSYDPAINTTEKPMDFAFLNASLSTSFFPPEDPWLRGHGISYYYFGYLMMANLTELTAIPTRISYNLALALIPAMAGGAAFGLVYNLVRSRGASAARSVGFALVAPVLLLIVSNLEGILEFVRLREWGTVSFWDWIGIKGLGPAETSSWRPTEYLWWWRGTRVIDSLNAQGISLDYTITEFPFFSFLLGDLHPHMMSIPFVLLFLGFCFNFLLSPVLVGARWVREHPATVFVAALLLGALSFVNSWDLVPFGLLWCGLLLFKVVSQENGGWSRAIADVWVPAVVTLSLAVMLYLPYYLGMDSQASGILPVGEVGTRPPHFLLIWGLFLVILTPFLLRQLSLVLPFKRVGAAERCPSCGAELSVEARDASLCRDCGLGLGAGEFWPRAAAILGVVLLPFFIWAAWQLGWSTLVWSTTPLVVVGERFLNTLPLVVLLFVALYSLVRYGESAASPAMTFVLAIASLAMLLVLGPEFLRVDDLFHNRMNTIFKVYYQAWVLLAIASAFGLYFLGSMRPSARESGRMLMGVWWGVVGVLLLGSLYYPVEAAFSKSAQFGPTGGATLDGLAYIAQNDPEEYTALRWLTDNGRAGEGVLEAVGQEWNPSYSRFSGSTGLSTVLGWPGHEHQWRGSVQPTAGREEDVATIYNTPDPSVARDLLRKYDIDYVVVSPQERASYRDMNVDKFEEIADVVFPGTKVTIYRVRP